MQTGNPGGQQFLALARGVFDAEFGGGFVVGAELLKTRAEGERNFRAAELGEFPDLGGAQNRHDAGHEGTLTPNLPTT